MKKKIIVLILIIQTMVCNSQIWSNLGAEWYYGYVNYGPPVSQGYLKLNYVHDSLIGSIVYKKLVVTPFYANTFGAFTNYSILLNENSKLITLFTGNIDTLFNFNANIGDKWLRVRNGNITNDVTRRYVTVIDTGHVIINSINLKKLVLSYQHGGYSAATTTNYLDTVYEKIGSVKQFLNPAEIETTTMIPDVSGNKVFADFRCYSDNMFTLYHYSSALNCTAVVGIEENKFPLYNISLFPNPTNSILNIYYEQNQFQNATIEIKNYLGQVVLNTPFTFQINISNLSTGIYFLIVKDKSNREVIKFMKE